MPTIDMQDTNRRAMTALNYASFLDDRHYLSHQGITAELVQRQRLTKSRKLLDELGEMLELTDDFLGALARLEDFSPLVASAEAKPSAQQKPTNTENKKQDYLHAGDSPAFCCANETIRRKGNASSDTARLTCP